MDAPRPVGRIGIAETPRFVDGIGTRGTRTKQLPDFLSHIWAPRGSVLRTRAAGYARSARVRSTEPRGTHDLEKPGGCFVSVPSVQVCIPTGDRGNERKRRISRTESYAPGQTLITGVVGIRRHPQSRLDFDSSTVTIASADPFTREAPASMRLVIDGRRLGSKRTGVGRYLEGLLEEWSIIGPPMPETLVVLHDPAGRDQIPETGGIQSVVVGHKWPGLLWENLGLRRILRAGDLLFSPTNLIPASWNGLTVLVAFDTLQEAVPDSFTPLVRWRFGARYRSAARRADVVIVPSMATAADVQHHYGVDPGRIRVILPAPGPSFRPTKTRSAASEAIGTAPYFLFLGKRSKRRNIGPMVAGFEEFRRENPSFCLVFAGPDRLVEDLKRPGLIDAGHVPESELASLISGATALLYLSDYEGFGLPIAEAMACGCPVLTLRNSALTEAGGEAAVYLQSPDPESIREALHRLAYDRTFRDDRIAAGLAWAARWTRRDFARRVKEILIESIRA